MYCDVLYGDGGLNLRAVPIARKTRANEVSTPQKHAGLWHHDCDLIEDNVLSRRNMQVCDIVIVI